MTQDDAVQPLAPERSHETSSYVVARKRATYEVRYPKEDLKFDTKDDLLTKRPPVREDESKPTIRSQRLSFGVKSGNFEPTVFSECNFHDKHGTGIALIETLTFRQCDFKRCIIGTTKFVRVKFRDCLFERVDFSLAEFEQCLFERCTFKECTAAGTIFSRTEIDPEAFLNSIVFPDYNMAGADAQTQNALRRDWVDIRLRLAEQLFRSNNDLSHSEFSDKGLYELKKCRAKHYRDMWWHGAADITVTKLPLSSALSNDVFAPLVMSFRFIVRWLTKGGTSLWRLAILMIAVIALYAISLGFLHVSFQGQSLQYSGLPSGGSIIESLMFSTSLILGFGFTAFKAPSVSGWVMLTAGSAFGIFSYSMLIPVLIRKVYR